MASNIDNLNFKVILDDKDFNTQIQRDIELARKLNTRLSTLLQAKVNLNKISAQEAASAKRVSDILTKAATNQEKVSQAKARTAEAEEKVATQAAKTAKELEKANAASKMTAVNTQKLATETQRTATEAQRTATATQNTAAATARAQLAQKKLADYSKQTTTYIQTQSRLMNELKGYALGYLSIRGASQLLSSLVKVTGEFELQKTTLSAMLGDLNSAEQIITRIQGLAIESPFQFKELTTYAKQLSAFSVPAKELYETTKMLADVSAGLGVGMDRIVLAYGQVRSAAFLRGQEVRQFTEAGIPILDELAKQFTELEGRAVSAGEVFDKISKRLVPFEMVAKVFKDMTSEGGKFYQMQEVQAETLRGKISNLKDAYEVMLNEIGKGQSENLKGVVDWTRNLMQNYEQTGRSILELVSAYGTYRLALVVATNLQSTLARNLVVLRNGFRSLTSTLSINPYAILAAGIAATGYAIYKASTHLEEYEKIQKSLADSTSDYQAAITKENTKLDTLYARLELAKKGTKEYDEARKQIYTQFAPYISKLKEEGAEIKNLANIYGDLKLKIEEAQKVKFREIASQDLETTYASSVKSLLEKTEKKIGYLGKDLGIQFNELEKQAMISYVSGALSEEEIQKNAKLNRLADLMTRPIFRRIENIKVAFEAATQEYANGLDAINELYSKAKDDFSETTVFNYDIEGDDSKAKKAIEERIKSVQRLQDAYEKLLPYLDEAKMKSTLKVLFPNISESVIDSLDFKAELNKLADELAAFDEDAAQRLRDTIGKDVAGAMADSFKALDQYKKMMESWLSEDFGVTGEGINFDLSKIISDLNTEYAKIEQKRIRAQELLHKAQLGDEAALAKVREVYGEEVWQKYITEGTNAIDELARKEKEAARTKADEKARDLANKYVKEQLETQNIDLSDLGEKSISQVRYLLTRLQEQMTKVKVEMASLYFGGLNDDEKIRLAALTTALDILSIKIDDTSKELDEKIEKKIFEIVNGLSSGINQVGDEMMRLADDIDSDLLKRLGKSLKEYGEFAKNISSSIKTLAEETKDVDWENVSFNELSEGAKGGVVGIIASVLSLAYNKITDIITSAYEQQRALTDATKEYADILNNIRREAYTDIFGTDEMGLATENAKILSKAQEDYNKMLDAFENDRKLRRQKYLNNAIEFKKLSVSDVLGNIAINQGWSLYGEGGELDIEAIKAYYDAYAEHLTKKQRAVVDDLIEAYDAQNDAAAQSAEYLTSVFGQAADNIAAAMVEAFMESGNAATDLSSIVSDIAKQMATDLIKTMYIMPALDEYSTKLTQIANDQKLSADEKTVQALAIFDKAVAEINANKNAINETLSHLEDYFQEPEEAGATLGEGIKGITEDTANLLASYLNAIRADVSYSKTLWVSMDSNIKRIVESIGGIPNLAEYQARIAANTYNTSIATAQILAELRSVLTSEGGERAVRIIS